MLKSKKFYIISFFLFSIMISGFYSFLKVNSTYNGYLLIEIPSIIKINKQKLNNDIINLIKINSSYTEINSDKLKFKIYEIEDSIISHLQIKFVDSDKSNLKKKLKEVSKLFTKNPKVNAYFILKRSKSEIKKAIVYYNLKQFKNAENKFLEIYSNDLNLLKDQQIKIDNLTLNHEEELIKINKLITLVDETQYYLKNVKKSFENFEKYLLNTNRLNYDIKILSSRIVKAKYLDFKGHLLLLIFTCSLIFLLLLVLEKNKEND